MTRIPIDDENDAPRIDRPVQGATVNQPPAADAAEWAKPAKEFEEMREALRRTKEQYEQYAPRPDPAFEKAIADLDRLRDRFAPELESTQQAAAERDSLFERLARATADFKNTQRRIQAEADQRVQYANQSLIKSLIPVIDNFERALAVDPAKATADSVLRGLQLVHDQWLSVLKQQGVGEILPRPGEPFDATRHEALMQQDAPQYAGQGTTVVQLFQKGYSLGDRVMRPAQVAVSRGG